MTKKFRIWNLNAKRFVDANDLYVLGRDGQLLSSATMLAAKNKVVQFWTGFLDKNDQEIYEGDIVVYSPQLNSGEAKCEVVSCAGGFRLARLHSKKGVLLGAFVEVGGKTEALQVVGNIFENWLDNGPIKD